LSILEVKSLLKTF